MIEPASEDSVDLDSMTKAQLLEYAEANGIEGVSSSMLKADILATIKSASLRGGYSADQLNAMTVAQIKALAEELGYTITATKKADIIEEFMSQQ